MDSQNSHGSDRVSYLSLCDLRLKLYWWYQGVILFLIYRLSSSAWTHLISWREGGPGLVSSGWRCSVGWVWLGIVWDRCFWFGWILTGRMTFRVVGLAKWQCIWNCWACLLEWKIWYLGILACLLLSCRRTGFWVEQAHMGCDVGFMTWPGL